VIDTPPALSILTVNALIASDYFLVPARADIFSLRGIRQLATTVAAVKQSANPKLKALGIVLTTYSARSQISRSITELLTEEAEALNTQVLQTKIRECAAMKEALALSQNIFSYAPKSTVAQDYRALIDEISREIKA
jgi:chromosome partitioning protein